jgi:hypothetical protein
MRLSGTDSWRVEVRTDSLIDCALWIRAAERLDVPPDPLVPGPADLTHPPAPISTADDDLADQWLSWWHSLIAPQRVTRAPDPSLEPAYGSPDPLGLAAYPALAAVVTQRWRQANDWHNAQHQRWRDRPSPVIGEVVRDIERAAGHKVRAFRVEFILIPVRDDVIRAVDDNRYLVPLPVVEGPAWPAWLRSLFTRLGL